MCSVIEILSLKKKFMFSTQLWCQLRNSLIRFGDVYKWISFLTNSKYNGVVFATVEICGSGKQE